MRPLFFFLLSPLPPILHFSYIYTLRDNATIFLDIIFPWKHSRTYVIYVCVCTCVRTCHMRTCVPVIEYTYCIVCPLRMNMLYIFFFMQLLSFSLFLSFTRTIILSSESHHHHRARTFSRMPFICSILFIVYYSFFFPRNINTFEIGRSGKSLARIEKENYKRNVILRYIDEDTCIVDQVCTKESIRRKFFFYPLF